MDVADGEMVIDEMRPWLGGYVKGGDEATWYPDLWQWLVKTFEVGTVLDVGCGEGHAFRYFRELGCDWWGVDGIEQDQMRIWVHDYTTGRSDRFNSFDLVWCCEFLEHVDERYLPNVLHDLSRGGVVALTHASPGQDGHHHVNCRPADYWIGVMAAIGYHHDEKYSLAARMMAAINQSPWNHFARSGMVFTRWADEDEDVVGHAW